MKLKKYMILAGCILMMGASIAGCGSEEEPVKIIMRADHDGDRETDEKNDGEEHDTWYEEENNSEELDYETESDEEEEEGYWEEHKAGQDVNDFLFTISNGKEKLNLTTASFEELVGFFEVFDLKLCPAADETYGKMIPAYSAPPLSGEYLIKDNGRDWGADYIFYNPTDMDLPDYDCNIGYLKVDMEDFSKKFSIMNGKVNKNTTVDELQELLDKKEIPYEVYQKTVITCKGESIYFYDDHEERIEVVFYFDEEGKNPTVHFDLDWSYWIRRGEKMGVY